MEISAKSTIQHKTGSLEEPHPPGTQPGYPKCIPADSPASVQQADTYPDGSPPLKKRLLAQRG